MDLSENHCLIYALEERVRTTLALAKSSNFEKRTCDVTNVATSLLFSYKLVNRLSNILRTSELSGTGRVFSQFRSSQGGQDKTWQLR